MSTPSRPDRSLRPYFLRGRRVFSVWTVLFSGFGCLVRHRNTETTRSGRDFFGVQRERKIFAGRSALRPISRVTAIGVEVEECSPRRAKAFGRSRLWEAERRPVRLARPALPRLGRISPAGGGSGRELEGPVPLDRGELRQSPLQRAAIAVLRDHRDGAVTRRAHEDGFPPRPYSSGRTRRFARIGAATTTNAVRLLDFFARHVRRTRALYSERRATLIGAAERELPGLLELKTAEAGMHLAGLLPKGADDREASRRAADRGVEEMGRSVQRFRVLARRASFGPPSCPLSTQPRRRTVLGTWA